MPPHRRRFPPAVKAGALRTGCRAIADIRRTWNHHPHASPFRRPCDRSPSGSRFEGSQRWRHGLALLDNRAFRMVSGWKRDVGPANRAIHSDLPCAAPGLRRSRSRKAVDQGQTSRAELGGSPHAYFRALTQGLENPDCQPAGRLNNVVVSNGGTPVLVLTNGRGTLSAPDELSCWSDAADALHEALDSAFSSAQQR
jgi:hypothetical protein